MQLEHSFTVPAAVEDAWKVLLDIERIAPCMPGAAIDSVDGDDFTGTVKVKLGPIGLTYKGKASFVEKDPVAHRVAINAQGRDARGNGTAAARVTATLTADGEQTKVDVLTDLDITGKPAQFGRDLGSWRQRSLDRSAVYQSRQEPGRGRCLHHAQCASRDVLGRQFRGADPGPGRRSAFGAGRRAASRSFRSWPAVSRSKMSPASSPILAKMTRPRGLRRKANQRLQVRATTRLTERASHGHERAHRSRS